jgi:hypothetical protein
MSSYGQYAKSSAFWYPSSVSTRICLWLKRNTSLRQSRNACATPSDALELVLEWTEELSVTERVIREIHSIRSILLNNSPTIVT